MTLVDATVHPYTLVFAKPLTTARGVVSQRGGYVVRVRDAQGRCGLGDAAAWPGFGSGDAALADAMQDGEALRALVCGLDIGMALEEPRAIAPWLRRHSVLPEAAFAIELALLDMVGQVRGVPVAQLLSSRASSRVAACALVHDASDALAAVGHGFTTLKLKAGEDDATTLARVASVRRAVGPQVRLRVDANGAWTLSQAVSMLHALQPYYLEWIEQPVSAGNIEGLAHVRAHGAVPIAADESIRTAADVQAVIRARAADVVVIKPMFVGGMFAAFDLAQQAMAAGLDIVVTHALESGVGRAGAAHLAAALAALGCTRAGGLSDPFANDVAQGLCIAKGGVELSSRAGLGMALQ